MRLVGMVVAQSAMTTIGCLVARPAATVTTVLYYSGLLPRDLNSLERSLQHQLALPENFLFHFLIRFLKCFW